jgi:hypothetical protein
MPPWLFSVQRWFSNLSRECSDARVDVVEVRLALRCLLPHCPERWPLELYWDAAKQENDIGRAQGVWRRIADIEASCQSASMIRPITLVLCAIIAIASAPAASRETVDAKRLRWVRGFLIAHWEYPGFLPDHGSGLKYMDFQLREEKWQNVYIKPVKEAYIHRPDETMCFRVIGQGYIAHRQPSVMEPWEGSQFIFVSIKKLKLLNSGAECPFRTSTNGS